MSHIYVCLFSTRQDLRPHDYHLIWPELAEQTTQP